MKCRLLNMSQEIRRVTKIILINNLNYRTLVHNGSIWIMVLVGNYKLAVSFHVLLYSSDSMLNGFGLILFLCVSVFSSRASSILSRLSIKQSSGDSLDSPPPTTSIGSSSSSSSSIPPSSLSELELFRCWERYSALRTSRSTVIPFALNFLACRSSALASFFLRRALK